MTKQPMFVFGLWGGDDDIVKKARRCARRTILDGLPERHAIYVFGSKNEEVLRNAGVNPIVMDHSLVSNTDNPWTHKVVILQQAIREFRHIIWIDWDVRPTTHEAWDRLPWNNGQSVRASLRWYNAPVVPMRKIAIGYTEAWPRPRKALHHGCLLYLASAAFVDRWAELYRQPEFQKWTDETALSVAVDEYCGFDHFRGWRHYRIAGIEWGCLQIKRLVYPPKLHKVLFEHRRKWWA